MSARDNFALSLSAFILVAIWVYLSNAVPQLRITGWIGLVSTAILFLTGAGVEGFKRSIWTGLVGMFGAAMALMILKAIDGGLMFTVFGLASLAFTLVAISQIPIFAPAAASFVGACCFIAAGAPLDERGIFLAWSWVAGLGLGFAVGVLAKWLGALFGGQNARVAAEPAIPKQ
jgi:hypothetical protein